VFADCWVVGCAVVDCAASPPNVWLAGLFDDLLDDFGFGTCVTFRVFNFSKSSCGIVLLIARYSALNAFFFTAVQFCTIMHRIEHLGIGSAHQLITELTEALDTASIA